MLNNSRVYPYKINDTHKTPYKTGAVRSDIGQMRKARSVSVQCYNESEHCAVQSVPKKVSFDQNIYVRLIHNREQYDKHMIRQLWWSKHELADLRKETCVVDSKEVSFLDFLFKICDWNVDYEY